MYLVVNEPISKAANMLEGQYDFSKHEYNPKKITENSFMNNLQKRLIKNDTRSQRVNMLRMLYKKYDSL